VAKDMDDQGYCAEHDGRPQQKANEGPVFFALFVAFGHEGSLSQNRKNFFQT
jgi:hypothetical protein